MQHVAPIRSRDHHVPSSSIRDIARTRHGTTAPLRPLSGPGGAATARRRRDGGDTGCANDHHDRRDCRKQWRGAPCLSALFFSEIYGRTAGEPKGYLARGIAPEVFCGRRAPPQNRGPVGGTGNGTSFPSIYPSFFSTRISNIRSSFFSRSQPYPSPVFPWDCRLGGEPPSDRAGFLGPLACPCAPVG